MLYMNTPSKGTLNDFLDCFDPDSDEEQVLVILGHGDGTREHPFDMQQPCKVPNRSRHPRNHYLVHVNDVPDDQQHRIIGVMHTHPGLIGTNRGPSYRDFVHLPKNMLGVVWHPQSGRVTFFERNGKIASTTWTP